jgi:acyl dehydratase
MAIKLDLVGTKTEPMKHSYTWKDCILYALGVGAKEAELDFLLEPRGPKVLPTFAVIPSFNAMHFVASRLHVNPMMILHGEQKIVLHRPIPPSGELSTVAEVKGIYDKGKGASVMVEARTCDEKNEPVFDNHFTIFVRGEGGFGGPRGPEPLKADVPRGRAPDFSVTETTAREQALLYRLSGDVNPLHAAPEFAKLGGFERPILHGLCTYGFAGRAVLAQAAAGDPKRLKSFAVRFVGMVLPGDSITTEGWQIEPGRWVVQARVEDRIVLSNALAETI